jgi:hypothetical protein
MTQERIDAISTSERGLRPVKAVIKGKMDLIIGLEGDEFDNRVDPAHKAKGLKHEQLRIPCLLYLNCSLNSKKLRFAEGPKIGIAIGHLQRENAFFHRH